MGSSELEAGQPEFLALVESLFSAESTTAAHEALLAMCDFVAECYPGIGGEASGATIRDASCIPKLIGYLSEHPVEGKSSDEEAALGLLHGSLEMLGTAFSTSFDSQARESVEQFCSADGLPRLQAHLQSPHPSNLLAAAALQNLTGIDQGEACKALRAAGCDTQLSQLISTLTDPADQQTVTFATGALFNLRLSDPTPPAADPAMAEALRLRRLGDVVEAFRLRRASNKVQLFARRWLERKRKRSPLTLTSVQDEATASAAAEVAAAAAQAQAEDAGALAQKREELKKAFAVFDADGSGAISVGELAEILRIPVKGRRRLTAEDALRSAEAIIAEYDTNGGAWSTSLSVCSAHATPVYNTRRAFAYGLTICCMPVCRW